VPCLQCFDTVGWAAGRASSLQKTEWWGAGTVICLERDADLHITQLMPTPLTVSCFSKIQIGFTFLVPAHPGSPGQRAVKQVCVRANQLCKQRTHKKPLQQSLSQFACCSIDPKGLLTVSKMPISITQCTLSFLHPLTPERWFVGYQKWCRFFTGQMPLLSPNRQALDEQQHQSN